MNYRDLVLVPPKGPADMTETELRVEIEKLTETVREKGKATLNMVKRLKDLKYTIEAIRTARSEIPKCPPNTQSTNSPEKPE